MLIEIAAKYWSYILLAGGVLVGVTKYYLNWLKIKESKLKIDTLEQKKIDASSVIYIPTTEEVRKYSRKESQSNSNKKAFIYTALIIIMVNLTGVIVYREEILNGLDLNIKSDSIQIKFIPKKVKVGEKVGLHYSVPDTGILSLWYIHHSGIHELLYSVVLNDRNNNDTMWLLPSRARTIERVIVVWEDTKSNNIVPPRSELINSNKFLEFYNTRGFLRKQKEVELIVW